MSDNIKVVVKVRPLISRELEDKLSYQWKVISNTLHQLDSSGKESGVQYTFDKVYDETSKTADVYKDVAKPIVEAAIAGFNGTIFAYGQTSSGKTYTMSGTETSPGIIQLAVLNLFEQIKCIPDRDFLVRVSFIEIYNETLKDLLNCDNDKIKVRDTLQGVKVDATEKFTSSPEEVLDIMKEGEANRHTGATNMNEESSRSHSIFQITIESREHTEGEETAGSANVSQLNLVDLAGSERAGQTGATGKRFKEGTHINKSLSSLALVIKQLSEGPHKHVNYRDSKLTRILQNSLGGNAKTSIICAVTPAAVEETISTLQFANRAKAIKNKPQVNAVATDVTKLQDLTKQLSKLQSELATKNHIEQDNRNLLSKIESLKKMILNGFDTCQAAVGGARRKTWCAPRRATIAVVSPHVPRAFCTPGLKYNPAVLPREPPGGGGLAPVAEERAMLTPPRRSAAEPSDDIINLDSDDDTASNTSHCSPYHKCFSASKTPPCVLRKKVKTAEKDLKDIIELTKREKVYNPEVVEYIEKLEHSANAISQMEEEIKSLTSTNTEKTLEIKVLQDKIMQTKIDVQTCSNAKMELEARCKEYNTKLTDLEVSYETLKTKAKLREDELLSLINEQTASKNLKNSSKSLSRTFEKDFGNFMDMSKDISLVSDNDSSIDSSNNEPSGQLQRLIDEMRTDVTVKTETIVNLESKIMQHQLTIESLESTCIDLREQITKTNDLLKYSEEENNLLKSSIETLNSTINSQRQNLQSAESDIESYNMVIKELQAKLIDKKSGDVEVFCSDISLEKVIGNEEKLIANNENMRNIIHSFKIALESRNKEIEQLKANRTLEMCSLDTELLTKTLEEKEKEILRLFEELHKSKDQIQDNLNVINKLMAENKDLVKDTDELLCKLTTTQDISCQLEKRVQDLEKENKQFSHHLQELNENYDKLLTRSSDFEILRKQIEQKEEDIARLAKEVNASQEQKQENVNLINKLLEENKRLETNFDDLSDKLLHASSDTELLKKLVDEKEEQIIKLVNEAHNTNDQIQENMNVIKKLMEDNMDLVKNTNDLSDKLLKAEKRSSELEKFVEELEKQNHGYSKQFNEFNESHDQLLKNLNELKNNLSTLENEKETYYSKDSFIDELKSEIVTKNSLISSLTKEQQESRDHLSKWKLTVTKVQLLLLDHLADTNEQDLFSGDASSFDELCTQLVSVENAANMIVSQKELAVTNNTKLQEEMKELRSRVKSLICDNTKLENDGVNQNRVISQFTNELDDIQKELLELRTQNSELNEQLRTANERYEILNLGVIEKEKLITSIKNEEMNLRLQLEKNIRIDAVSKEEVESIRSTVNISQAEFDDIIQTKIDEITHLKRDLAEKEHLLDIKCIELQKLSKTLEETIFNQDHLLENIHKAAAILLKTIDSQSNEYGLLNSSHSELYSKIIGILHRATKDVVNLNLIIEESNNAKQMQETIDLLEKMKDRNLQLENENSCLTVELGQMKVDNRKISDDLVKSNDILIPLQIELREKIFLIENLESKIEEWKKDFSVLEDSRKRHLSELQINNSEVESQSQNSVHTSISIKMTELFNVGSDFNGLESGRQTIRRSLNKLLVEPRRNSPQSLLTLCCNRIFDAPPSDTELNSVASSNTNLLTTSAETQTDVCDCEKLLKENGIALDENMDLKAKVDYLQAVNFTLVKEQEEIRKELKLLLEPAHELQKKISNHKTILSTLTATTYAENKLLKSQVKVLQHHNNRIYNVCQRELPGFKKSLQELSAILKKSDLVHKLEANIKRFSLPEVIDRNNSYFKDESTLDGDLLMLDNNVTLTSVDNTLLAQDQTCLDGTQMYLETEINTDIIETIDPNILHTQLQILSVENEKLTKKLITLKAENLSLIEQIEKHPKHVKPDVREFVDAQNSPIKLHSNFIEGPQEANTNYHNTENFCYLTEYYKTDKFPVDYEKMTKVIDKLTQELLEVKAEKSDLEQKYNNLNENVLANDRLKLKINDLETNNSKQLIVIDQLTSTLSSKNEEFIKLQEENDLLSTQVMEAIDDSDVLRKEVQTLKEHNTVLNDKCAHLEELIKGNSMACIKCYQKSSAPNSPSMPKSVLNRSRSDSATSSCCNKLSTLQNELSAGREDCRTISEDVATIKNHLERSDLSITLDDSMGESNVFSYPKVLHVTNPAQNKFPSVCEIPEPLPIDFYVQDKEDCFNYYIQKTGAENNFSEEIKIIEIMRMLYDNIVTKHGNEVENLVNKLKDFEESRNQLQERNSELSMEYAKITQKIQDKDNRLVSIAHTLQQVRDHVLSMNEEIPVCDGENNTVLVTMFKNNILSILDKEFDLCTATTFENLIDKIVNQHKYDLLDIVSRYSELQGHMELLTSELRSATDNLNQMKCQVSEKEKEYNLLMAQKEKVLEITSAVTLDIVQREHSLAEIANKGCQKLIEYNVLTQDEIYANWSVDQKLSILTDKLVNLLNQRNIAGQEKHNLVSEVNKFKSLIEDNDKKMEDLKLQNDKLHELCKNATSELLIKNENLETLKSSHGQLDEVYRKKVKENDAYVKTIHDLTQEMDILKATVKDKDSVLQNFNLQNPKQSSNDAATEAKLAELIESINSLRHENKNLKSVNDVITNESEQNALQLAQADDTIKKNKIELDKLTAEIVTLNQSMKESMSVIEELKLEAKSLLEQNLVLKKECEKTTELCSQLKLNIKTHEKTAEIQCKIISRLKDEKESSNACITVKDTELKDLAERCDALRKELELITKDHNKCKQEAQELREAKESLERRVHELESQAERTRARGSLGAAVDVRRRRHSLLDSQRALGEERLEPDHKKLEAYFFTQEKPDDMFMDVDDHSNRSTPARNRRSDSFQSRHEESDEQARPSSAQERRRRRQSLHDARRGAHVDTQEHLKTLDELKINNGDPDSELTLLKDRLKLCQQELEELRERYREVDEECETCAEYLRERDQQCMQLKTENKDLQQQIAKLNDKLQNASIVRGSKEDAQRSFANASVNTDEDWANLHSVVVDRMSFDREVEKNKALQRCADELRFKNGELKAAMAKMRKAAERAAAFKANLKELEAAKQELETCKRELEECKERRRELDEECETCGEYLRERDEQLCRLKEERDSLQAKLEALMEKEAGSKVMSLRKRRQSVHDLNRDSAARGAATGSGDPYLESEESNRINETLQNEIAQLKMALRAARQQPALAATGSGVVQNQHLTEVMKENQKLKKMNAKLITICKKRGKPLSESNCENDDPADVV